MAQKPVKLTSEKLAELKEAFMLFDYMKTGHIYAEDVGPVIRSIGLKPSEAQLKAIRRDIGQGGKVDLQGLVKYISQAVTDPPSEKPDDLNEMFRLYDVTGSGTITVEEMTHLMTTIGEKLTEEEVMLLLKQTRCVENNRVNYRKFTQIVLSG